VLVLHHELHEAAELSHLTPHIGVEQGVVALATSPEHVVGAAQAMGGLHGLLHLRGRAGEDLRVGVRGGSGRVAGVAEEIRRAPEQADAAALHGGFGAGDHVIEIRAGLRRARALGRDVAVVKGEEGYAELLEELEGRRELALCERQGLPFFHPGPREGPCTEYVAARPTETVPVADGNAQMLRHGLAEQRAFGVVVAIGQGLAALGAAVLDGSGVGKEGLAHDNS